MQLSVISKEINTQLADPAVMKSLVSTTFNGMKDEVVKKAIFEGMLRGWKFENFLKKDVYAIPFGGDYSLVSSIDYCRKVAFRTGLFVGKEAPLTEYDEEGKRIVACSITVKKICGEHVGEFTAKILFKEYNTGKNQWAKRPHTMIAKVAEMHALRMAFPEELDKVYIEGEMIAEEKTAKSRLDDIKEKSDSLKMGSLEKKEKETEKSKTTYIIEEVEGKWNVYNEQTAALAGTLPTEKEAKEWVNKQS